MFMFIGFCAFFAFLFNRYKAVNVVAAVATIPSQPMVAPDTKKPINEQIPIKMA